MDLHADVPTVGAALAASLIAVDGVIEDREKEVADKLGHEMLPGFSSLIFETLLDGLTELPSAYEVASTLRSMLSDAEKATILQYLTAVAKADSKVADEEQTELQDIARALGVKLPPLVAS